MLQMKVEIDVLPVVLVGHKQSLEVKLSYSSGCLLFDPRTQKKPGAQKPDGSVIPFSAQ